MQREGRKRTYRSSALRLAPRWKMLASRELLKGLNEDLNREVFAMLSYLHMSFLVFGPNRHGIVEFFRREARESMEHAIRIGEKITALGGAPSIKAQSVSGQPKSIRELLEESRQIELTALNGYRARLKQVGDDVALRVMLEEQVASEQEHLEEVDKYLRE